jgi:hypothetical protein
MGNEKINDRDLIHSNIEQPLSDDICAMNGKQDMHKIGKKFGTSWKDFLLSPILMET